MAENKIKIDDLPLLEEIDDNTRLITQNVSKNTTQTPAKGLASYVFDSLNSVEEGLPSSSTVLAGIENTATTGEKLKMNDVADYIRDYIALGANSNKTSTLTDDMSFLMIQGKAIKSISLKDLQALFKPLNAYGADVASAMDTDSVIYYHGSVLDGEKYTVPGSSSQTWLGSVTRQFGFEYDSCNYSYTYPGGRIISAKDSGGKKNNYIRLHMFKINARPKVVS